MKEEYVITIYLIHNLFSIETYFLNLFSMSIIRKIKKKR